MLIQKKSGSYWYLISRVVFHTRTFREFDTFSWEARKYFQMLPYQSRFHMPHFFHNMVKMQLLPLTEKKAFFPLHWSTYTCYVLTFKSFLFLSAPKALRLLMSAASDGSLPISATCARYALSLAYSITLFLALSHSCWSYLPPQMH